MSCREFQDELVLYMGQAELPEDLRAHVESCAECGRVWSALANAADHLGDDSLFQLNSTAQDELIARIDERIDATTVTDIRPRVWIRYAAAAAAVLVLGIIGVLSALNYSTFVPTIPSATVESSDGVVYSLTDAAYDLGTTEDDLAAGDVGVLMHELVSQSGTQAADALLDGISEDEMKYLEANLKVGDLL